MQFTRTKRGRRGLDDQFYAEIAREYRSALADGKPPVAAIAQRRKIARHLAAAYVFRARRRGFLTPTQRGKKGGRTTQLAADSLVEKTIELDSIIYGANGSVRPFQDLFYCFGTSVLAEITSGRLDIVSMHVRSAIQALARRLKEDFSEQRRPLPPIGINKDDPGYWAAFRKRKKAAKQRGRDLANLKSAVQFFAMLARDSDIQNAIVDLMLQPGFFFNEGQTTQPWKPRRTYD